MRGWWTPRPVGCVAGGHQSPPDAWLVDGGGGSWQWTRLKCQRHLMTARSKGLPVDLPMSLSSATARTGSTLLCSLLSSHSIETTLPARSTPSSDTTRHGSTGSAIRAFAHTPSCTKTLWPAHDPVVEVTLQRLNLRSSPAGQHRRGTSDRREVIARWERRYRIERVTGGWNRFRGLADKSLRVHQPRIRRAWVSTSHAPDGLWWARTRRRRLRRPAWRGGSGSRSRPTRRGRASGRLP